MREYKDVKDASEVCLLSSDCLPITEVTDPFLAQPLAEYRQDHKALQLELDAYEVRSRSRALATTQCRIAWVWICTLILDQ